MKSYFSYLTTPEPTPVRKEVSKEQFIGMIERFKPKEIYNEEWSSKGNVFIYVTEYNETGFKYYFTPSADKTPVQGTAAQLYDQLKYQGIGSCYIIRPHKKLEEEVIEGLPGISEGDYGTWVPAEKRLPKYGKQVRVKFDDGETEMILTARDILDELDNLKDGDKHRLLWFDQNAESPSSTSNQKGLQEAAEAWRKENAQWVPDNQSENMLYESFIAGANFQSEVEAKAVGQSGTPLSIVERMNKLTDDERLDVISTFCKHCGSLDQNCPCWNDE